MSTLVYFCCLEFLHIKTIFTTSFHLFSLSSSLIKFCSILSCTIKLNFLVGIRLQIFHTADWKQSNASTFPHFRMNYILKATECKQADLFYLTGTPVYIHIHLSVHFVFVYAKISHTRRISMAESVREGMGFHL